MCCIISSLVQLMSDKYFRTITGFQSLIQKEWVTSGHPFCDRLGHIINSTSDESPIFLLYLDCVWQLIQQFPSQFEFTETYLTSLWDTVHVSIFDTFLFNCERERYSAAMDSNNPLILRSAWDWHEQYTDQDISLFQNPLFYQNDEDILIIIIPKYDIPNLEFWSQNYFRWIPPLEIINGGKNHTELYTRILQSGISQLEIDTKDNSSLNTINTCMVQMNIDSFYPFGYKKNGNTISTPIMNTSMLMSESFIDTQSIITAPDG